MDSMTKMMTTNSATPRCCREAWLAVLRCIAGFLVNSEHGADQALAAQLEDIAIGNVHAPVALAGERGHVDGCAVTADIAAARRQIDGLIAIEDQADFHARSEERRVGKECRSRW